MYNKLIMKFKIILFIIVLVLFIFFGVFLVLAFNNYKIASINNFEDCKTAGYPILETYPEQCKTPDNRTFVRIIVPKESLFNSSVTFQINESIKFPDGLSVTLLEINDSRCKQGVVCIWAGELAPVFALIYGNVGEIQQEIRLGYSTLKQLTQNNYIFSLDNVTETTATITVTNQVACTMDAKICPDGSAVGRVGPNCEFAPCPSDSSACYIGGCSSQICSDQKDIVSTCEYREEYACYKNAECKRQANGQCGWTETTELKACLNDKK